MMKSYWLLGGLLLVISSCKKTKSNGETIFRTGKNLKGEVVSYREIADVRQASGCENCHGRRGGNVINKDESIKYKDLSDPKLHNVPYNDSLLKRFLDLKLKSDGTTAKTPIITKMGQQDKEDLILFLKTL
jgi:hypothetical protein